jgi:hypothetical protein
VYRDVVRDGYAVVLGTLTEVQLGRMIDSAVETDAWALEFSDLGG